MIVFYHAKWNLAKVRMNLMRSTERNQKYEGGLKVPAFALCFWLPAVLNFVIKYFSSIVQNPFAIDLPGH